MGRGFVSSILGLVRWVERESLITRLVDEWMGGGSGYSPLD